MCLAVPMRLISARFKKGMVKIRNVGQEVDLSLVDDPRPGDYVIVHAGFAIEKLDRKKAGRMISDIKKAAKKANEIS